jgi:hypothetical protein
MAVSDRCCRNADCPQKNKFGAGNVVKHRPCYLRLHQVMQLSSR